MLNTQSKGLDLESGKDITIGNILSTGDVNIDTKGAVKAKDPSSRITGNNIRITAIGNIGEDDKPLNIISTGDVKATSITGHTSAKITYIRPKKSTITDSDDNNGDSEDEVYPRIAAKQIIILEDNKVAKAARAILKGESEDTQDDATEPATNEKVEDGKKGTNLEPANGNGDDTAFDSNLLKYLAAMLLILLLIAIISGAIILNSKKKNQQVSE